MAFERRSKKLQEHEGIWSLYRSIQGFQSCFKAFQRVAWASANSLHKFLVVVKHLSELSKISVKLLEKNI